VLTPFRHPRFSYANCIDAQAALCRRVLSMNMDRRTGWKHWFADVGYIYVVVAVLVGAVLVLADMYGGRQPVRTAGEPTSEAPGYGPPQ